VLRTSVLLRFACSLWAANKLTGELIAAKLIVALLSLLLCGCKHLGQARKQAQTTLDRLYPGQFEVYASTSSQYKLTLQFYKFNVFARSKKDQHFHAKLFWHINKPNGGLSDQRIRKYIARAYWRLLRSRQLAAGLPGSIENFSLYVSPLIDTIKKLPLDRALDESWLKVLPKGNVEVKLYLYRDVYERNRRVIEAELIEIVSFLRKNLGNNSRLSLSFLPEGLKRKYGALIYPYRTYRGGNGFSRTNNRFRLVQNLEKFSTAFWSKLKITGYSRRGRQISKQVRAAARQLAKTRNKHLIKSRFVKMNLNPGNIDLLDFYIRTCRQKFVKRCPRSKRGYWGGQFDRNSGAITFAP